MLAKHLCSLQDFTHWISSLSGWNKVCKIHPANVRAPEKVFSLMVTSDSCCCIQLKATFHVNVIYCFFNWDEFPLQIPPVEFDLEDKHHPLLPNISKWSGHKCVRRQWLYIQLFALMTLFLWRQLHTKWQNVILESEMGLFFKCWWSVCIVSFSNVLFFFATSSYSVGLCLALMDLVYNQIKAIFEKQSV